MPKAEQYVVFTAEFTFRCPRCGKAGKRKAEHCVHNTSISLTCVGCGDVIPFQIKLADDVSNPVTPLCGGSE